MIRTRGGYTQAIMAFLLSRVVYCVLIHGVIARMSVFSNGLRSSSSLVVSFLGVNLSLSKEPTRRSK